MKKYQAILAGAALLAVPALCSATLVESFESGTLNGWNADTVNGATGTVNMDRASDGIYSYGNTFTVSSNFAGYSVKGVIDNYDARSFIDAGTTTMSVDVYSDWTNPNGWSLYANTIVLTLNYEGGYHTLAPTSGGLSNGSFQTLTYDVSAYAAEMADPGLSYSTISFGWNTGTYGATDGQEGYDNGTQTLAIDNVQVIPEPATIGLLGVAGVGLLAFRRRIKM
jgi:hypothetical protein